MIQIEAVIPREQHCLEVALTNGSTVILSFASRLQTVRFGVLADPSLFKRATTDGTYVRWDRKVEISIDEIFQLAQKASN